MEKKPDALDVSALFRRDLARLVDYLTLTLVVIPLIYLKVPLQCSNPAAVLLTSTLLPPPHQHHLPLGLLGPPPRHSVFPLKNVPT